jgi:hypothetical protein
VGKWNRNHVGKSLMAAWRGDPKRQRPNKGGAHDNAVWRERQKILGFFETEKEECARSVKKCARNRT